MSLAQVPLQQQRAYSDQAGRAEEAEGENGGSAAEAGKVSGQRGGFLCCFLDEFSKTRHLQRKDGRNWVCSGKRVFKTKLFGFEYP